MEAVITPKLTHICPFAPACHVVCIHRGKHEHHAACDWVCLDSGCKCEEAGTCHFCEETFPVSQLGDYEGFTACKTCLGRTVAIVK